MSPVALLISDKFLFYIHLILTIDEGGGKRKQKKEKEKGGTKKTHTYIRTHAHSTHKRGVMGLLNLN